MNCAQHTDTAAVAYCRSCGKALCEVCKRDVQGTIFCEPCLAARINPGASGNYAAGNFAQPVRSPEDTSPGLALFLGFIPGVGAFYNGQFLKGFVHVIIFSTLIWVSDHGLHFFGLFVAAWYFYMIFDAWSTAKARRYGLPIPDPLGINQILEGREGTFRQRMEQAGERMGTRAEYMAHNLGQQWQKAGGATPGSTASNFAAGDVAPGANPQAANPGAMPPPPPPNAAPGSAGYSAAPQGTYPGPEGMYGVVPEVKPREHNPVGAVVLIGFGVLFLLANLGWFSFYWVSRFWPVILITLGVWLFVKRQRGAR